MGGIRHMEAQGSSLLTRPRSKARRAGFVAALVLPAWGGVVAGPVPATLPALSYSVTLRTPAGVAALDVTLAAQAGIVLQPQTSVTRAGGGPAWLVNPGPGGVLLHPKALAGQVASESMVSLLPQAHLLGGIRAHEVSVAPGAVVDGPIDTTPVLTPVQEVGFPVEFPEADAIDVTVKPRGSFDLAPGRYRYVDVSPNGTLILHSGSYYIDRLTLRPNSMVELRQENGATRVFVVAAAQLAGSWSFAAAYHGLVLVQTGPSALQVGTPFHGVLIATDAALDLANGGAPHRGAFFARSIRLGAKASVVHEAANPLVSLIAPPGADIQRCAESIRPRDDLTGEAREIAFQADIARYCTMAGADDCTVDITARANVDYFLAAAALIHDDISPAQYLAIVRDRTRKRLAFESDAPRAQAFCRGQDADGDWVVDSSDSCPNTPPRTATVDSGCPDSTLPPAPSRVDVHAAFVAKGFLLNAGCSGATVPPTIPAGAFYRPANLDLGSYIFSGRVTNQPPGCPVWYFFDIEEHRGTDVRNYTVAFGAFEEERALVGFSDRTVPTGFIQFNSRPTDVGTRGLLGLVGQRTVRFRVRAMNGAGMRGGWSEWKVTTSADCRALGFTCG